MADNGRAEERPMRPTPNVCACGRPDHQDLIRQLGVALGLDLPAMDKTPERVWNDLLDEVERCRLARDVVVVDAIQSYVEERTVRRG